MLMSQDRILTTHTGSLPRPAALTELYVRRSRNETIDPAELDTLGKAAVQEVVAKQIAAGIDVGNNGEQQREAFFLYVRHRMSGFGGGWTRQAFADVAHYPAFGAWKAAARRREAIDQQHRRHARRRSATVRYLDRAAGRSRVRTISVPPSMTAQAGLRRTVHDRPLARHHRRARCATRGTTREDAYLAALGRRPAGGIRGDRRARLPVADRRPRPRDGAPSLLPGPPASATSSTSSNAWWQQSTPRSPTFRATGCACMPAGATTRARTTATWPCPRSCRRSARRRSAASCCRSPILATPHEYRLPEGPARSTTTRSSSPASSTTSQALSSTPKSSPTASKTSPELLGDPRRVQAGTDCGFDTSAGMGRVTEDVMWANR